MHSNRSSSVPDANHEAAQWRHALQEAAGEGRCGETVLRLLDRHSSPELRDLLASEVWRWPQANQYPLFTHLAATLAIEGNEEALKRLRDEELLQKGPHRCPWPIDGARRWTATEIWMEHEHERANREDQVRDPQGNRLRPWTVKREWAWEDRQRQLRLARLLQDDRTLSDDTPESERGCGAVEYAVANHFNHLLPVFFAQGERPDVAGTFFGARPLHVALAVGNLEAAELLVEDGADPHQLSGFFEECTDGGWETECLVPPLHFPLTHRNWMVNGDEVPENPFQFEEDRRFFREGTLPWAHAHGWNLGVRDEKGRALLAMQGVPGDLALIQTLIQLGVSVHQDNPKYNLLAFHLSHGADAAGLQILLDAGAAVDWRGKNGQTLLHVAAQLAATPEVWAPLLNAGLDLEARDQRGNTPFLTLCEQAWHVPWNHLACLLYKGADVCGRNDEGETSLIRFFKGPWLSAESPVDVVRRFVDAGADVHAKTRNGLGCLSWAVGTYPRGEPLSRMNHMKEVIHFLMESGVDATEMEQAYGLCEDPSVRAVIDSYRQHRQLNGALASADRMTEELKEGRRLRL